MSAVLQPPMTLAALLDWENRQETKYEFDGFQPVAMTGGTAAHASIQRNLRMEHPGGRRCSRKQSAMAVSVSQCETDTALDPPG
jgi:hypothetical protein